MSHVIGLLLAVHPANALNNNYNFEVVVLLFMFILTSTKIPFQFNLFPKDLYQNVFMVLLNKRLTIIAVLSFYY